MTFASPPTSDPFRVVHCLRRRVRLSVPSLAKDEERLYILAILLRKHAGVRSVRVVPAIGSVLIYFDPDRLPQAKLLVLVAALINNHGATAGQRAYGLRRLQTAAPVPLREFTLALEGMSCASCALLIEARLRRDPRIASASVNFATATASVRGRLEKEDLFAAIADLGYRALAVDTLTQRKLLSLREQERLGQAKSRAVWSNVLNLPGILLALAGTAPHSRWLHWFEFGTTIPIALWSGQPLFSKAWTLLRKHRSASMDTLVTLGVGLAYSQGLFALLLRRRSQYLQAGMAVVGFVMLGRYLEQRAKAKAHEAIRALLDRQPQTATLWRDGREFVLAIEDLRVGDVLLVRPGERIPADGVVLDGLSTVDESLLTGESAAVVKQAGERVIGGCVNGGGALRLTVTAVGADSVLAGIIQQVDFAQSAKLPVQARVDRLSALFMPTVMSVAVLSFSGSLLLGAAPAVALSRAIAVLLIACPCALGLATPAAVMVGTGEAARRGIFIRNGASLETAAQLSVIVFDKTGTITAGQPRLTDCLNVSVWTDAQLLAWAAAAESHSEHALGKALAMAAQADGLTLPPAAGFVYQPGQGIAATVAGRSLRLGNAAWLAAGGVELDDALAAAAEGWAGCGKTPVFLAVDGQAAAALAFSDAPRAGAQQAIADLHALGLRTLMLTGDHAAAAAHVAAAVGITEVIAEASPAHKLAVIHALQQDGGRVGMIGDGVNDAPALAAADVGLAIGTGTALALDSADINLVRGDIGKVTEAMQLSAATLGIIRQNLTWAIGYNALAIPLAAFGAIGPMGGSIAMSVSSLAMLLNALRLRRH